MTAARKLITEACPACKQGAVLALWDHTGEFVLVDPDETGDLAGAQDGNGFAWVRPVGPHAQLALDDALYRLHEPSCPAPAARVRDIMTAPSLRHRRRRPLPPRTAASAR